MEEILALSNALIDVFIPAESKGARADPIFNVRLSLSDIPPTRLVSDSQAG